MADFYVKYGGKNKTNSLLGNLVLGELDIKLYSVGEACDHFVVTKNRKIMFDLKNQDSINPALKRFNDLIYFETGDLFNY